MKVDFFPVGDLVLGIDLGGTKTLIGVIGPTYDIHYREEIPTSLITEGDISALVQGLEALVRKADRASGEISAIGLGIAGVPDARGVDVFAAPNLGLLPGSEIGRGLSQSLGIPVIMENDANLAAVGEHLRGVAKGISDLVYISAGTGLGVGLISRGEVIRGHKGGAGEIGSILSHIMDPDADRFLTFEELLAGPNFASRAGTHFPRSVEPADIIALAEQGDPMAARLLDEYIYALAELVTILRSIVDPEMVVLGGGLGSNQTVLMRLRVCLKSANFDIPIVTGRLGNDAALVGARVMCERREESAVGRK